MKLSLVAGMFKAPRPKCTIYKGTSIEKIKCNVVPIFKLSGWCTLAHFQKMLWAKEHSKMFSAKAALLWHQFINIIKINIKSIFKDLGYEL